ncbi:hypothetical protein FQN60_018517 [Etheostoma spectabile]|uniref:Uncharacterized protein n=1 Tax=Etheostoma spectabile TaxID=54343 RepID=A0A5J5DI92_9PERO|nr:hypothetical protein FQN60_018517 [Etheostoma spectabile]
MDVSIAVSLIRGQMGAVVERAVNVAVETVLAEMLKVVGVKFEELKAQVALMKRDAMTLQREKAQLEKETDNIRAKLRYTELKLKYYRQGVEEELQQRASASTLVRIHPSTSLQAQRGGAGVFSTDTSPSCLTQTRTSEGPLTRSNQVFIRPTERDTEQRKDQEDDCEWTLTQQPYTEGVDAAEVPPTVQALTLDPGQQSAADSLSPYGSTQADSSTLTSSAPQVKQEAHEEEEEQEEVICIKEEPEEEQEVMSTLLLDCQVQQGYRPDSEAQKSVTEWSGLPASQRNHTAAFSSARPTTCEYICVNGTPQSGASLQSMVALPSGIPPRQAVRPWTKDLSLYEEYKLRRNELRRRSINKRRELEKTLPQPLLADLSPLMNAKYDDFVVLKVRERREKTRLRVARWRAKRKLQACINQTQALGGAAGLSQAGFPNSSQHQQLRVTCAATSSSQQGQSSALPQSVLNNMSASLPFMPSTSSSSSPLLPRGPNMAAHQHAVTSSSSYPQVSLMQQSISLTDTDILQ